jgi:hypothetical protein
LLEDYVPPPATTRVVVYKVDRVTRSLADFAKLIEIFDGPNRDFVPWRFSDAGRISVSRDPSCRRPKTCT